MAAAQLSDEDLFSELKRLGFTPGPVTENTRPVYLKKLKKLREEPQCGSRSGKIRNSVSMNTSNSRGSGNTAAGGAGLGARPANRDVMHIKSSRSPGTPSGKRTDGGSNFVLGFSSDESDVEVNVTQNKEGPPHSGRGVRGSGNLQQQPPRSTGTPTATSRSHDSGSNVSDISNSSFGIVVGRRGGSGSPWRSARGKSNIGIPQAKNAEGRGSGDTEEEDYGEDHVTVTLERDVVALNGSRGSYTLNNRKLGGDYSDSEDEEIKPKERQCDRRPSSRRSQPKSLQAPHICSKGAESYRENTGCGVIKLNDKASTSCPDVVGDWWNEESTRKTDQAESALASNVRYLRRPRSVSAIMGESFGENSNWSTAAYSNNHVRRGDGGSSGKTFTVGIKPHVYTYHSPSESYWPNHSNRTAANHASIPAMRPRKLPVPEEDLLQQFKRDGVSATGGFSAHYLSMFLLTAACLFFVLLGLMYLRMRGSSEVDVVIKNHPFGIEFDNAYVGKEKDIILKVLLHLHDHLAKIAGNHDCGDENHHLNRSLSLAEASDYIMLHSTDYGHFVAPALEWIIRTGEDVGIRLIGGDSEEPVTEVSEVTRLESTHPKMSFICHFQHAFYTVIHRVVLLLAGIGVVLGVLYYLKYHWRKEEEETRKMYDMVERIIDVLRSHSEVCQENKDLLPYLPIPHVRDSLVQPQDRKKIKKVWDRAVDFLSANESRIRTETQRISGEDFLVWRWTQPSQSCDKICNIPSKVWQGKAFPLDRRNSPPNSLTPCLKIRNMFDPVMEVGENWHLAIHEAILEKCSDNDGIVHIAVDKNLREGCVYVKCLSAEHSGKAFKALHGSWFDGKLVTVKYLRLDRYHQRFPKALGCNAPLKPASKHLNTLAHLRHRKSAGNSPGFS